MLKEIIINEEGQGLVEYGFILIFVSVSIVILLTSIGESVVEMINPTEELLKE